MGKGGGRIGLLLLLVIGGAAYRALRWLLKRRLRMALASSEATSRTAARLGLRERSAAEATRMAGAVAKARLELLELDKARATALMEVGHLDHIGRVRFLRRLGWDLKDVAWPPPQ